MNSTKDAKFKSAYDAFALKAIHFSSAMKIVQLFYYYGNQCAVISQKIDFEKCIMWKDAKELASDWTKSNHPVPLLFEW